MLLHAIVVQSCKHVNCQHTDTIDFKQVVKFFSVLKVLRLPMNNRIAKGNAHRSRRKEKHLTVSTHWDVFNTQTPLVYFHTYIYVKDHSQIMH